MGSVHHLGKFIPKLLQLCHPLRPLLKKNTKLVETDEHAQHLKIIKTKIAEATENKHFNPNLETRIKCEASQKSFGCALEQRTQDGWHTVAFTSRFLKSVGDQNSTVKIELLVVVWSTDNFKYYLNGKIFTVRTDHRASLSIIRKDRANKSYNSRLTRWVDRLLPFVCTINHLPGSKLVLVGYISREPQQKAVNISTYDEQLIVAKLDAIKRSAKRFLLNAENYTDFAARNPFMKLVATNSHSCDKLCSKFAPQNHEYSKITNNDNTIRELTPNNSHSADKIEVTNIPHSLLP